MADIEVDMGLYYAITIGDDTRWHLETKDKFLDGTPLDIWAYSRCAVLEDARPVPLRVRVDGRRVDYNVTAFLVTVVSKKMADVIAAIAPKDIQRIPALVDGVSSPFEVLNIVSCIDCVDHKSSLIQYYPSDHPTKAGRPRGVIQLVLEPSRIGDHHIFHPKDWRAATIISDVTKVAIERSGATGIEFSQVAVCPERRKDV